VNAAFEGARRMSMWTTPLVVQRDVDDGERVAAGGQDMGRASVGEDPGAGSDARGEQSGFLGNRAGAGDDGRCAGWDESRIEDPDATVCHQSDHPVQVAAGRGEERVHDGGGGGRSGRRRLESSARTARVLLRTGRAGAENVGDLREGHTEQVVQNVCDALRRCQPVEHHHQRAGHRLPLQVALVGRQHLGGWQVREPGLRPPPATGAQLIQTHPGQHGGQPCGGVARTFAYRDGRLDPRALHRVFRVLEATEHAERHRGQLRPDRFEI